MYTNYKNKRNMNTLLPRYFGILLLVLSFIACEEKPAEPIVISSEDFHISVSNVTEVMIHDIFSPPQASRIYAYPNVAAYEILASKQSEYNSLAIHRIVIVYTNFGILKTKKNIPPLRHMDLL